MTPGGVRESEGTSVPPHSGVPHYHGNNVRVIFLVSAIVLIVGKSTGADLPLSITATVISAAILVVAAGITNPAQFWIHWVNAILSALGTIIFGTSAIEHYRAGVRLFDPTFTFIEALSLLSLVALYFTTRTIRGIYLRRIRNVS